MLQRFPIRVKLFIALAVPLFALLVVAAFEVVQTTAERTEINQEADLSSSSSGNGSLLSKIEDERNAVATFLTGQGGNLELAVEDLEEAFAATDDVRADFTESVDGLGGEVAEAFGPALDNLDTLAELRAEVQGFDGELGIANFPQAQGVFDRYSELMAPLFDASRDVTLEIDDPDLRRGAELLDLAAHQTDLFAKLTMNVLTAVLSDASGVDTPDEIATISGLKAELDENQDSIETKAAGDYRPLVETLLTTPHVEEFSALVDQARSTGTVNALELLTAADGSDNPGGHAYSLFRAEVEEVRSADADRLSDAATRRVFTYWGLAFLALVVAGLATWLVSRSITRPLRALTRQATEMANHRLPDAVLDILDTPLG
ncbi:MAG: nitrate- and nitrite sensing domain-containing protein, partial [Acidimicrobiales bacterium]